MKFTHESLIPGSAVNSALRTAGHSVTFITRWGEAKLDDTGVWTTVTENRDETDTNALIKSNMSIRGWAFETGTIWMYVATESIPEHFSDQVLWPDDYEEEYGGEGPYVKETFIIENLDELSREHRVADFHDLDNGLVEIQAERYDSGNV